MLPRLVVTVSVMLFCLSSPSRAQAPPAPGGNRAAQFAITQRLNLLRDLDAKKRPRETRALAGEIRKLPPGRIRLSLATALAKLTMEGDFGDDTRRAVADSLSEALGPELAGADKTRLAPSLNLLAEYARYENVLVTLDNPLYTSALAELDAADTQREAADFTLTDTSGKTWTRKELAGRVVVLHFFATWQPDSRQELSDLEKIRRRFQKKQCIVLGVTDEPVDTVQSFLGEAKITYPILLDGEQKARRAFHVGDVPRTLIFDANGKLAAQTLGRRGEKRYRELLSASGMR